MKKSAPKIIIEKGISIPDKNYRMKYPWDYINVGESFLIPNTVKQPHSLRGYAKNHGLKVTIAKDHKGKFRCWILGKI